MTAPVTWPGWFALVGFALLLSLVLGLDFWILGLLWAGYALVLLLLWYRGGGGLLGPVFFCDLVRTARQGRLVVLRCAYAALLLAVLFAIYSSRFAGRIDPFDVFSPVAVSASEMPEFTAAFFAGFLAVQMVVVFLLTPVLTAGAIAEERERRTLEFLLTTHLTDQEIVLGKLASRLGNLAMLLLTGLPILGILQMLGGVDPQLVLAGFAATAATTMSVGSLSILISVLTRQPLAAVFHTYLYLGLVLCLDPCIPGLNYGHPVIAVTRLRAGWTAPPGVDPVWTITLDYVLTHAVYAAICLVFAVTQLRRAARQAHEPPLISDLAPVSSDGTPVMVAPVPIRPRPPVRRNALLWKEMYVEQEFRWERVHPLLAVVLLFASVCTAAVGLTIVIVGLVVSVSVVGPMYVWMQVVGTTVLCLICIVTGFYASGSVSRERERQTLDSLLTIPETLEHILNAKWLGSLLSARQLYPLLALVYGLALLTGSLHPLAVPLVAIATLAYIVFATGLGLYFSVVCSSTMRATAYTLVAALAVVGGTWLAAANSDGLQNSFLPSELAAGLETFLRSGLPPPMPLMTWSFPLFPPDNWHQPPSVAQAVAALLGLLIYLGAGLLLRRLALIRMRALMR